MCRGVSTAMIGACPEDGPMPNVEVRSVRFGQPDSDILAALIAERHRRYLVEAEWMHQLEQCARAGAGDTTASRFISAVRTSAMAGETRVRSWRVMRWQQRLATVIESSLRGGA